MDKSMKKLTKRPVRVLLLAHAATLLVLALTISSLSNAGHRGARTGYAPSVFDTVSSTGEFSTLVAALQVSGLAEVLRSEGPFTLLAPSDEAFSRLPVATLDALMAPANKDRLRALLEAHVIPGEMSAADTALRSATGTLAGAILPVSAVGGEVTVAGARFVDVDIAALNGTIHVVDAVILPVTD